MNHAARGSVSSTRTEGIMAVRQLDAVAEVQSAFSLLTKNWVLGVPTAIAALLGMVFFVTTVGGAIAAGAMGAYGGASGLLGMLGALGLYAVLGAIVLILVSLIAHATVMASSEEAWNGRPVDLGAGLGKALACLVNLIIAGILIFLMMAVLAITIVGPVILAYFLMYTFPAIVIGGHNGVSAIGESFRVTSKTFGTSIVAFLTFILAAVVGGIVNAIFSHVWGLNFVVAIAVGGFVYAFIALVLVRFYDLLRATA
jgi:hypothetical protein